MNFLTDEETEALIMALAAGQETFTEEDGRVLTEWANGVKLNNHLLQGVLDGSLVAVIEAGEIEFRTTDDMAKKIRKLEAENQALKSELSKINSLRGVREDSDGRK